MSLIFGLKRTLRRALTPAHAVVLTYHSVLEGATPFAVWQHMSRSQLEQHLRWLSENCHCISVTELLARIDNDRWSPRCVAVTFDDGFANNLHVALPLLEKYRIPATFFIASGFIGSGRMIWPEVLLCVLAACRRPDIVFFNERFPLADASQKAQSYQRLARHLRRTAPPDVDRELSAIAQAAQVDLAELADLQLAAQLRMMSWEELGRLAESPWVEIGAHTVSHPQLSALPLAQASAEILQSRRMLEERLGAVPYFAYPYGSSQDFTEEHRALLKAQGFKAAFSANAACVTKGVDLFSIPRLGLGGETPLASLQYQLTGGLAMDEGRRRWSGRGG